MVYDKNNSGESIFAVIVHASIVRAMIDYVFKATGESGKIVVADTPQSEANFATITNLTGLQELVDYIVNKFSVPIELRDLRKYKVALTNGVVMAKTPLAGDSKGMLK